MAQDYKPLGAVAVTTDGTPAVYTTPTGKQAVVSSVTVAMIAPDPGQVATTIWLNHGGNQYLLIGPLPVEVTDNVETSNFVFSQLGWTLSAGDSLTVEVDGVDDASGTVYISIFGIEIS